MRKKKKMIEWRDRGWGLQPFQHKHHTITELVLLKT
uniref:Uncharacterized protein n=1 Tax=Rhizophora mucronata TaxID=61149 RepID=A0A2P2INB0_RHIMU